MLFSSPFFLGRHCVKVLKNVNFQSVGEKWPKNETIKNKFSMPVLSVRTRQLFTTP